MKFFQGLAINSVHDSFASIVDALAGQKRIEERVLDDVQRK